MKLEQVTIIISDSQTWLSLCYRRRRTLDLSTSLIVSRVQEVFSNANRLFTPGKTFVNSVDHLTGYRPNLQTLINQEFYCPTLLLPEIGDRVTVKVEHIKKQPEETLPDLCAKQQIWALMKGSSLGGNLLKQQPSYTQTPKGFNSTGSCGPQRK